MRRLAIRNGLAAMGVILSGDAIAYTALDIANATTNLFLVGTAGVCFGIALILSD